MIDRSFFRTLIQFNDAALTDAEIALVREVYRPVSKHSRVAYFDSSCQLSADRRTLEITTSDAKVTDFLTGNILKALSGKNAVITAPKLVV